MKYWRDLGLCSRHERHVRDPDNLHLFSVLLVFFIGDSSVLARNPKRVERMNNRLACVLGRKDLLILIVLKVAVGQVPIVFRGYSVVSYNSTEVFRLDLCNFPGEHFENNVEALWERYRVWRTHDRQNMGQSSERGCWSRGPWAGKVDQMNPYASTK